MNAAEMVITVMNWKPNNKSCMRFMQAGVTEEEMACKQVARVRCSLNTVIRVDSFIVFGCKEGFSREGTGVLMWWWGWGWSGESRGSVRENPGAGRGGGGGGAGDGGAV